MTAALRTSLIWHDEVMSDLVSERPRAITIGPSENATFVTPELGLPERFAIVRPGLRGHVLTLGAGMRGTVCIEGVEQDVATLVTGGFHATVISGLDWGVIELDASGKLKLFFQFVGVDNVPVKPLFEQEPEQRASLVFSTVLHGALLFATYQLYVHHESDIEPTRDLTARYVPARLETMSERPAVAMPAVTVKPVVATPMTIEKWSPPVKRRDEKLGTGQPAPGPKPLWDRGTQKIFDQLTQKTGVGQLAAVTGDGKTPGAPEIGPTTIGGDEGVDGPPGTPHGNHVEHGGVIDTGPQRQPSLCVGSNCGGTPATITPLDPPPGTPPSEEPPSLTEKEISDVIERAKGRLTLCYQREVNRDPSLAGTVHVRFEIGADGRVSASKVTASTVRSDEVNDCLARSITTLHFPARGRAVVNYPFVFAIR